MSMAELLGLIASVVVPLFGGVVWLVRLEGRLNVQTARQDATEKRVDGLEERIFAALERIENKLDSKADR